MSSAFLSWSANDIADLGAYDRLVTVTICGKQTNTVNLAV